MLSSIKYEGWGADKCIDGITDGPDMCHTNYDEAPWIALDFGEDLTVSVHKVFLYNRADAGRPDLAGRTRNVTIRLSDELPTSATSMFTGGHLLGTFAGPGTPGQQIEISAGPGWSMKIGRYLIVQMDNGHNAPLNLNEVVAFGSEGKKL